ncbi:MAG: glycosyltransferase [Oscillospiraceae bacterium]|nr:glycosyltransferase [Oscillospiraceae bacterium]
MKKIKVLETGFTAPFGKGGMEVMAWEWYENIDRTKVTIDFMGTALSDEKYVKYMADNGSKFFLIEKSRNTVIRIIKKINYVRKTARENNYDIVHIHAANAWMAFQYYIAAKPYCSRIIIHSHSTGIGLDSTKMNAVGKIKFILHKICRHLMNSKKIIRLCCSETAAEWMFPKKYKAALIKNGIRTSDFVFNEKIRKNVRKKIGAGNRFVIGHIGRFSYSKNHDFLIDIFEEVYKKNPDSLLLLIGMGALEDRIKEKVRNAGLEDNVIFYGTSDKVNELYNAMDCFVLPSHFEGLGIVAVEAQAAGLCALCSDAVPLEAKATELLEFMPLSESSLAWAEKILGYNNSYERRDMSADIKKEGYDIKTSAKQLEEIYIGCTKKN